MDTTSLWQATADATRYPRLDGDASTDVLVIGGGITGLTLALLLARQGRAVMVLEADAIGSGSTGRSTGNLYETVSDGLDGLEAAWDAETTRQVVAERREAIGFIERLASGVPAVDFRRCDLMQWALDAGREEQLDREAQALRAAGCDVVRAAAPSLGLPASGPCILLRRQAQFHPQAWLVHLATLAGEAGARLHEHSPVLELDATARRAVTAAGTVQASEIVMATHTPKGVRLVHAEMPVHREYGIALPGDEGDPGPGIYWAKGDESLSVRPLLQPDGRRWLVCIGQSQTVGTHNATAALMALEAQARRCFGERGVAYRWSAQNYRSADGLPYIGRDSHGLFLATGFSTDGLTWGTVAARLIAAQLDGQDPAFGRLCRPGRLSPVKGGRTILEEIAITARALVRDYLTHRQQEQLGGLAAGDSAIVEADGKACAAWRAPDGQLHAVSAVCTHMGCRVHWNSAETSWDCPCHGSRFRPDGSVIEGPALHPLERLHPSALERGAAPGRGASP